MNGSVRFTRHDYEDDILIWGMNRSVRFTRHEEYYTSDEGSEEEVHTISSSSSEGYHSE